MHSQSVEPSFWWMILAVLVIMCISVTTETPLVLVVIACLMVIGGVRGLLSNFALGVLSPWMVRVISAIMIVLGAAFLAWYFSIGRTSLHPIVDTHAIFESVLTRTPER
jgi:hypothetical protein